MLNFDLQSPRSSRDTEYTRRESHKLEFSTDFECFERISFHWKLQTF